jgi:hypothetical protein
VVGSVASIGVFAGTFLEVVVRIAVIVVRDLGIVVRSLLLKGYLAGVLRKEVGCDGSRIEGVARVGNRVEDEPVDLVFLRVVDGLQRRFCLSAVRRVL